MKKLLKFLTVLALVIILPVLASGCLSNDSNNKSVKNGSNEVTVTTNQDIDKSKFQIPPGEADNLVKEFAEALNAEDESKILSCMTYPDDEYYTEGWAQSALENYKTYFNGEKIEKAKLTGPAEYQEALLYRLYAPSGKYKEIQVNARYTGGELDYNELAVHDNILQYSYPARKFLDTFTGAIHQNNPEKIASLLTYDDYSNPYPDSKAETIIENYTNHFDVQTIQYVFTGTETPKSLTGNLIYTIQGTKNGDPDEHKIEIVYGDELVGLKDKWTPNSNNSKS